MSQSRTIRSPPKKRLINSSGKQGQSTMSTNNNNSNRRKYPNYLCGNKTKSETVVSVPPEVQKRISNVTRDIRICSDRPQQGNNKILIQKIKLKAPPKGTKGGLGQKSFPVSMKAATTRTGRADSSLAYDYSYQFDEGKIHEDIMSRKSSLSLLEQKKLQWAQEREELNGLWSPWGRPTDVMSQSMGSPSASIVSAGYANKIGLNTTQSEYHLPPISSTIVQQPRRSSLWTTDENNQRHFNPQANVNNDNNNDRKSSLPICISTSAGELHFNGSNTVELKHHSHNAMIMSSSMHSNNNGWASFDEDTITSGYQSENNGFLSNGDGEYSRNGSGDYHSNHSHSRAEDQEQDYELESRGYLPRRSLKSGNKNSSRSRSEGGPKNYDENDSPTRGKNYDSNSNPKRKSKVVIHKILTENDNRQEYEYMINAMTEVHRDNSGRSSYLYNSRSHPNLSHSGRMGNAPPPAMRSSITFGIDASHVADYREIEKQEKERWLNELEKQREEQRMRREMERDDRERPRWGDKGIGVGHFWEPAVSENARLPPPGSSRGDDDPSAQSTPAWLEKSLHRMENSKSPSSLHEMDRNHSQDRSPSPYNTNHLSPSQSGVDLRNIVGYPDSYDPNSERTFIRGQNVPCDPDVYAEKEKKRQAALEHQEAIRKQMEERQIKLKQEREKKILEEKNEEERIARQQQLELERLEAERRKTARGKENVDESNSLAANYNEGGEAQASRRNSSQNERRNSRAEEFAQSKTKPIMRSVDDNTGRELARRQSLALQAIELGESKSMTNIIEEVSEEISSEEFMRTIAARCDQSIMTESEDLQLVRVLTPTLQRSRSLITAKEFGTQTEGSETNSSSEKSSAKNRSHNCLTEKGREKEGKKKKKGEKPRWGENPVKKQYLKQSEKDPVYQQRIRRRMDRMKRREDDIVLGDTGTESEENINNRQIRIRKNGSPPRPIMPMRAKVPAKNFNSQNNNNANLKSGKSNRDNQKQMNSESSSSRNPPQNPNQKKNGGNVNALSGGRPLGRHTLPTNNIPTSEESSGFSSPAQVRKTNRRDIGAGDAGDFDEYSYLSMSMHEHLPDINPKGSALSYASEYMGELPPNLVKTKKKNAGKGDLLPNKTSRASFPKPSKNEEKSPRKSSISPKRNQNPNQKRNSVPNPEKHYDHKRNSLPNHPNLYDHDLDLHNEYTKMKRNAPSATVMPMTYDLDHPLLTRNPPMSVLSQDSLISFENRINSNSLDLLGEDSYERKFSFSERKESRARPSGGRNPPISTIHSQSLSENSNSNSASFENHRLSSPPVPALLKKMQMGFNPDEFGRMSSLQNEIGDSPTQSRSGSRISNSTIGPRIDIDIAVTSRPEFKEFKKPSTIFEQSEGTGSSITTNNTKEDLENDIGTGTGTRESSNSKSLESQDSNNGIEFYDVPPGGFDVVVGIDPKESNRSNLSYMTVDRPLTNGSGDLARQERFIYSVMSNDDVQAQLSARESELSEKGIIEFSVRLPSQTQTMYRHDMPGHKMAKQREINHINQMKFKQHSIESSLDEEYQDPLASARNNCVRWLYSSDDSPKESVLTHLSYLKKGIMMQQQEWGVVPSDTEEEVYENRR